MDVLGCDVHSRVQEACKLVDSELKQLVIGRGGSQFHRFVPVSPLLLKGQLQEAPWASRNHNAQTPEDPHPNSCVGTATLVVEF